jgi:rhodanese-related sulfurtransferase
MNLFRAILGGAREISPDTNEKRYVGKEHILLDVRNPQEYSAEHIAGAINIPLNKLQKRIKELPADQPIVCVSRDGRRGHDAAELLEQAGYSAVNILGGMQAWRKHSGKR